MHADGRMNEGNKGFEAGFLGLFSFVSTALVGVDAMHPRTICILGI